ncbi:MAG: hypothetical protein IT383_10495 [Deltaproteobacteria bacterium]|nr:hypothetical protein [Deltaproteobacteria bacterium]
MSKLRGVPIEHIAAHFFAADPFTGRPNKNPTRACERRVRDLAREGYFRLVREHDGQRRRQLVVLGQRSNQVGRAAERPIGSRARLRRVPARNGAHHVRTLDAVAELEREIVNAGGHVLAVTLDGDIRGAALRGRRTSYGDRYPAFPDAVIKVKQADGRVRDVAVEYVTSKYTSADIREKHAAFAKYGDVIWVADTKRTAERVTALTGATCRTSS